MNPRPVEHLGETLVQVSEEKSLVQEASLSVGFLSGPM